MTLNQLKYWENRETIRANKAQELENSRSHKAQEAETARHNREMERQGVSQLNLSTLTLDETRRSNQARELETSQHNREQERINSTANYLRQAELNETERTHKMNENINLMNLAETAAHNRATESESFRHNKAGEILNYQDFQEKQRHNLQQEAVSNLDAATRNVTALTNSGNLTQTERRDKVNQELTRRGQNLNVLSNMLNSATKVATSGLTSLSRMVN